MDRIAVGAARRPCSDCGTSTRLSPRCARCQDGRTPTRDQRMRAQYVRDHRGEGCARASEDCTQDLTVDHVVPSSRGGAEDPRNFQLLCGRHNSSKGAR